MVSTPTAPGSLLDAPAGDLVLRICGSSRDGQIVRLRSAKCTIGSGPRSTLRLRARGVRPTHCLIVRGSNCTVVRRWSPDTRLNGRDFADKELAEGDRLSIGTIELEVLDPGRLPSAKPAEADEAVPQDAPPLETLAPCRGSPQGMNRLAARLTLANRQGRRRARRLLQRLRASHQEVEQLRKVQAEQASMEKQLSERAEALDAGWRDLERQREALECKRRQGNVELAEARKQVGQPAEQLPADRAEGEALRTNLDPRGPQSEDQHPATASPPRKDQPPVESKSPWPLELQEAPRSEPIDIGEVFRRMSLGGSSSAGPAPLTKAPQPSHSPPGIQPSPPLRPPTEREEESIEEYMAGLLDRLYAMRGDGTRPERESRGIEPALPADPASRHPAESPAHGRPALPPSEGYPRGPAQIAPRTVAPERHVDLSTMRELANLSAHTAIDRHSRRRARAAIWGKAATAAVGLGAGAVLLEIWWTSRAGDLTLYAALVALLVALLWGLQCVRLTGRAILHKSRQPGVPPSENHGSAALNAAQSPDVPEGDAPSDEQTNPASEEPDGARQEEPRSLADA